MRKLLSPKTILLVVLLSEVIIYALLTQQSRPHSLTRIIDTFLISPSILGVLLLWLYQYYADDALRTLATSFLAASIIMYTLFILFGLYMLTQPHTIANTSYTFYLFIIPLCIDALLLVYNKKFAPVKPKS